MAKAQFNRIFTKAEIDELRTDALPFYHPEIAGEPARTDPGFHKTRSFVWSGRKDFDSDISGLTNVDITSAKGDTLYSLLRTVDRNLGSLVGQNPVEGNMPSREVTEGRGAEEREAARQKIISESNEKVRAAIAKQQEIHNKLQASKTKIYVKAVDPVAPKLSDNAQAVINDFKNAPKEMIPILTERIEKSISPSLHGQLTPEQIHLIAEDAAYKGVDAANNPEKYVALARQNAILNAVVKDNTVLPKVIKDADILANVQIGANEIKTFQDLQTLNPRNIFTSFDPNLAKVLFPAAEDFQISFSETQLAGYNTIFNPDGLIQGYSGFLINNLEFFGKLVGLPIDKFKHEITSNATSWLTRQIAASFPQAAKFFASSESQLLLGSLGIGTISIELPASMGAFFIENAGALPVLNFFSGGLGINFAVGGSVTTAATAQTIAIGTAEATTIAGGTLASEAFLGGAAVAGAAGGAEAGAAAGALTGPLAPVAIPVLAAAGALVGKTFTNVVSSVQRFIKDNDLGEIAVALPAGLIVGFFLGIPAGIGAGTATFLGTSFLTGGTAGLQSAINTVGAGVFSLVDFLWTTFLAGVATPLVGFFVGLPLLVAFILIIINNSAYVVPPGVDFLNQTNPYISVTKRANPTKAATPTSVTYTVTITARKDTLTGVTYKANCHAQTKSGTLTCPKEQIPDIPDTINAGTPFSFTFTSDYGAIYKDSLVLNTFTINATSPSGGKVSETGSASVCFGDCPLDCFDLTDPSWKAVPDLQSNLTAAAAKLAAQYQDFAAKVCAAGTIKLCYTTSNPPPGNCDDTYAIHFHGDCDIAFNRCGIKSPDDAIYMLAHESTHHIQDISGEYERQFIQEVPQSSWRLCTYSRTANKSSESMAEGDALYVNDHPSWNSCISPSFAAEYPKNYQFAKGVMFGQ